MKYLDKYPNCIGCPVKKWCGTMISCIRLCKSYRENKEETQMNYEERYNQALERAKVEQETFFNLGNVSAKTAIERIFPELKESEDEVVRKALIEVLHRLSNSTFEYGAEGGYVGATKEQMLAWLEKQGEQKSSWSEEDEEMYKEVLMDIIYAKNDLKTKGCLGLSKRAMKAFNWFSKRYKSLRPQSKWKPSKEQLTALKNAIIGKRGPLYDLYFDLENL